MARIGGRSNWLAVPAGMLCIGVVAALVWLALPMFPVALAWVGDTSQRAITPRPVTVAPETPAQRAATGPIDCRALYPDGLWAELTWTGGALLAQTTAPPATRAGSLVDALAPTTRVTCGWQREDDGGIITTLAVVGADAVSIADAALRGQGFTCTTDDVAARCTRARGDVLEEHTVRDGLWLSSIETQWQPEDYGARLEAHLWG